MKPLLRKISPATVIAMIALAVALGGTSYAAVVLPKNSVGTKQLKKNAVTSAKVKNRSLLKVDFKAGQLPAGPRGAKGATGNTGATGPSDAFSAYLDGPVALPSGLATIATLTLPDAGSYVIFAKAWLFDNVNSNVLTDCRLSAEGDTDQTRATVEGNSGTVVTGAAVSFSVVHKFTAPGVAELKCNGFGVNVSANQIKITAIKVANLTNSAL
jgi:hypothetical protein